MRIIFNKWKEYSDKKKILYFLKTIKTYNQKYYYEKKKETIFNDINTNFLKQFPI